jgi:hypothetical protein
VSETIFYFSKWDFLKNEVKNKFHSLEPCALEKSLGTHLVNNRRNFLPVRQTGELFEVKRSGSEFLKFQIRAEEG